MLHRHRNHIQEHVYRVYAMQVIFKKHLHILIYQMLMSMIIQRKEKLMGLPLLVLLLLGFGFLFLLSGHVLCLWRNKLLNNYRKKIKRRGIQLMLNLLNHWYSTLIPYSHNSKSLIFMKDINNYSKHQIKKAYILQ